MKLYIIATWIDPRLVFNDLKERKELNILTAKHKLRIWMPQLIFANTLDNSKATFNDEEAYGHFIISKLPYSLGLNTPSISTPPK